jgi:hypothetical protein
MSEKAKILVVAVAVVACLSPFAAKAFHIDDPLFLWMAEQIRAEPLDPYGFTVNWYGRDDPAATVIQNPPGAGYFIAAVSALFGNDELALHLAFLLPALGTILGTFFLARELGADGSLAALAALINPLFLISATQIMCDVTMLCLWVWAVHFWIRGIKGDRPRLLLVSAILVAACALTKYFGMCLIPLLLVYGVQSKRRVGAWTAFLLIPCAILGLYQMWTAHVYGRGMLFDAASYARNARLWTDPQWFENTLTGLAFVGGGLSFILLFAHWIWSRRQLVIAAGAAVLGTVLLPLAGTVGNLALEDDAGVHWGDSAQLVVFALLGVAWVALAFAELRKSRDADTVLLVLWLLGTFAFATFVNWSVNGRSVLPLVPVSGVLLARQLGSPAVHRWSPRALGLVAAALILAVVPTWADHRLAGSAKRAATQIMSAPDSDAATVWYMGHWGFQYYMDAAGARAVAMDRPEFEQGDLLVIPSNNTNVFDFPPQALAEQRTIREVPSSWVSTMTFGRSGFYSDGWGPLPYAFGRVPPETYRVHRILLSVRQKQAP